MFSWVLYVCEIFWFQSLLSIVIHGFSIDISAFHLNPPPFFFFHCSSPRSKSWLWMCQELCNKLSVYWIKLLRNQYVYMFICLEGNLAVLFLSGSDSPEPCLCTSLPKEKNQVGGTHVSFVYKSARPQTRLLLTGKNNFLFILQDNLAAFRCKSPSPQPPFSLPNPLPFNSCLEWIPPKWG